MRVLSPGDNGKVEQSNVSSADALAVNLNKTEQSGEQNQYGSGHSAPAPRCEYGCDGHGDSTAIQALGQSAANKQDADADASSKQIGASNVNAPVRVGSEGDNGKVEQANVSSADAVAGNLNKTEQSGEQNQGGGLMEAAAPRCDYGCGDHSGTAIQALGQQAYSDQKADADASSKQTGASNVNAPVREGSDGDNGSVKQLNASGAEALAFNVNDTDQSAEQDQGGPGHGTAIQALGQDAGNRQHADADATSEQICPVNLNAPGLRGQPDRKQKSKDGKDKKNMRAPKAPAGRSCRPTCRGQLPRPRTRTASPSGARSTSRSTPAVPPAGASPAGGDPALTPALERGYLRLEQEARQERGYRRGTPGQSACRRGRRGAGHRAAPRPTTPRPRTRARRRPVDRRRPRPGPGATAPAPKPAVRPARAVTPAPSAPACARLRSPRTTAAGRRAPPGGDAHRVRRAPARPRATSSRRAPPHRSASRPPARRAAALVGRPRPGAGPARPAPASASSPDRIASPAPASPCSCSPLASGALLTLLARGERLRPRA